MHVGSIKDQLGSPAPPAWGDYKLVAGDIFKPYHTPYQQKNFQEGITKCTIGPKYEKFLPSYYVF